MSIERLQKILAQAGIASRRKAEELIEQGLVSVNGKTAKLGDKADFTSDHIKVEGKLLRKLEDLFYVVMNKPKGVISMMSDPEGRPTIADFLSKMKAHVNPIGRLDFNSEGLLLLTNDGAMAEKIQKSDAFPRVYHVKVKGHITTEMIDRLSRGVRLAEKFAKPLSVRIHEELNKKTKIEIVFLNAANVDVKAFFEAKGFLVEKITRTGFGHLTLHGLEPGKFRIVPKTKFEALFTQPELGVKALNHRLANEREILPRDQRMRNVDEHGKVIPKLGVATRAASTGAIKIAPRASKTKDAPAAATSGTKGDRIVVRATGDVAPTTKPGSKKPTYSASVDMPKFKKRTSTSGSRIGAAPSGDRPRPSSDGEKRPMSRFGGDKKPAGRFGARGEGARSASPRRDGDRPAFGGRDGKPRFSPRAEGGPRADSRGPRSDSRGPRSDSRGPRPDSRGPRPDSRGPRSDSRGPRSDSRTPRAEGRREGAGGRSAPAAGGRAGFSRRPITKVKRRET
jgi:23S rRNA pseudouridine2605 synthase